MAQADGVATEALPLAPSLAPTLALAEAGPPPPSVLVDSRVVLICALSHPARCVRRRRSRSCSRASSRLFTNLVVLRPLVDRRSRRRRGTTWARLVDPRPRRRRRDRRAHGALRLARHPRPRHPRGDGAGAHQREPHPGARHVPEAAVGGDRDRHRRAVRRRRADHRHRRRARLARRPAGCATSAEERKTLLAAGAAAGMAATFGSPVSRRAARRRAAALRVSAALAHPGALASRRRHRGAHRLRRLAADLPDARPRCSPAAAALAVYVVLGAAGRRRLRVVTRAVYAVEDGVRQAAGALDVVAGARRGRRRRRRLVRAAARWASATTTSSAIVGGSLAGAGARACCAA